MQLSIVMLGSKSPPRLAFKDCAIIIYSIYIMEDGGVYHQISFKDYFQMEQLWFFNIFFKQKKVAATAGVQETNQLMHMDI